jgi:DNA-binding CsgD family transcriptional regulator
VIRKRYYEDGAGIYTIAREIKSSFKNVSAWMDSKGWEKRDLKQGVLAYHQAHRENVQEKTPEISVVRSGRLERMAVVPAKAPRLFGAAKLDANRDAVLVAASEGFAGYRIAKIFHVAEKTVYDWLRANDIPLTTLTDLQVDVIDLWKTTDLNMRAIAKRLGCSRTYVSMVLRKVGIEDRRGIMGRRVGSADGRRAVLAVAESTPPVL